VRAATGQAVRQGAGQPLQGQAVGAGNASRWRSASAPRQEAQSPMRGCTSNETGERKAAPERSAQA